jgi:WD40 repeat protein
MQGWKDKQTFRGHKTAITALAFNPSGDDTFASASADNTVKVGAWSRAVSRLEVDWGQGQGWGYTHGAGEDQLTSNLAGAVSGLRYCHAA